MSFRGSQKAQYNKLVEALLAAREALEKALAENVLLEARLSTAADKQILLLNRLIDRDGEISSLVAARDELVQALARANDDAKGKRCPDCGEPMVSCSTLNERVCNGCGTVWDWHLEQGQPALIGNNRQGRRTAQ